MRYAHSSAQRSVGALCALAAACLLVAAAAAPALGASLVPQGNKVFFGVSDTGDPADFGGFSEALGQHPALIQTFRTWGSDFPESIERWQTARARPVLHVTTADNNDGHELIGPRGIAAGGDSARADQLVAVVVVGGGDVQHRPRPRGLPAFDRLGEVRAPGAEGLDQRRVLAERLAEAAEVGRVAGVADPEEDLVALRHQRGAQGGGGSGGDEQAGGGKGAKRPDAPLR